MKKTISFVLAATLLLAGLPASAQETPWERVREAYPPQFVESLRELTGAAAGEGVPVEAILEKVLEGAAKGIPHERVLPAVREYAGRLARTRDLLGREAPPAELVAGAEALRRGVAPEAVRDVASTDGGPVALIVLGDLVESRVPADHARAAVEDALERGRRGDDLLAVSGIARRMIREGVPPDEIAAGLRQALSRGAGPPGLPGAATDARDRAPSPPVPPGAGPPEGRGPPEGGGPPGGGPPGGPPGGGF